MASKLNKTLKIDYKKELKAFYTAKANKPTTVQVPVMNYTTEGGSCRKVITCSTRR